MNRREVLRTLGTVGTVGFVAAVAFATTTQCAPTPAPAASQPEPDPILFALHAHTVAYAAWQASHSENDPDYLRLDKLEQTTWERVCQTPPTTLYGLARMASYVQRHLTRDTYPPEGTIDAAWISIATAAATLHARSEVPA